MRNRVLSAVPVLAMVATALTVPAVPAAAAAAAPPADALTTAEVGFRYLDNLRF